MKIRMKIDVGGMFHGNPAGVKRGDEVDVDEATGLRYIANDYAEAVSKRDARKADRAAEVEVEDGLEVTAVGGPVEDPPHAVNAEALEMETVVGGAVAPSDDVEVPDTDDPDNPINADNPGRAANAEAVKGDTVIHEEPKVLDEDEVSEDAESRPKRSSSRRRR